MHKRFLVMVLLAVLVSGSASANGLLHNTCIVGDTGDYTLMDAVFLNDRELLLVGYHLDASGDYQSTKPWAEKIDPWTGDLLWSYSPEVGGGLYSFYMTEKFGEGFVVCARSWDGEFCLIFVDAQDNMSDPVQLDAYADGITSLGDNLVICGYTDKGAAFADMLNSNGDYLWRYITEPTGEELSRFSCVTVASDGILLGGSSPGGALLTKLSMDGHPIWTKQGGELGSLRIAGIAVDKDRIVLASNTYEPSTGILAGAASSLTLDGEILHHSVLSLPYFEECDSEFRGVYVQKSGQGYTYFGSLENYAARADDDPVENFLLVNLVDRDLNHRNEYYPPFGTNANAVKVLRSADDTVWVVGHGNYEENIFRFAEVVGDDKRVFVAYFNFTLLDAS